GWGVGEMVGKGGGVGEEFLGEGAANDAGAADAILLGDQYACSVTSSDPRGAHTARACSDHEQIEVTVGHAVGSKPSGRAASDAIRVHQLRPSVPGDPSFLADSFGKRRIAPSKPSKTSELCKG